MSSRTRSNSKSKKSVNIDWDCYLFYIDELITKIKKSKIKFDYCYGVPRGGLIPATIISHKLNIPYKEITLDNNIINYKKAPLNILVVDDLLDTGTTLKKFFIWKNNKTFTTIWNLKYYIATIFKHEKCKLTPDFFACINKQWIKFPYEKD